MRANIDWISAVSPPHGRYAENRGWISRQLLVLIIVPVSLTFEE
jgi:hypothetical protein